jgi:hypothetical protein
MSTAGFCKDDEITMTNPTGQTYTDKLNGTDAPMKP